MQTSRSGKCWESAFVDARDMAMFSALLASAKLGLTSSSTLQAPSTHGADGGDGIQRRRGFDLSSGANEEIDKYQQYIQMFNMERWLALLGDATFATTTVPFSPADAREFLRLYDERALDTDADDASVAVMPELAARLQASMDALSPSGGGCFVKCSSRSAKDYADPTELAARYTAALGRLTTVAATSENICLAAMSYASMELLRSCDAARVLGGFARSERIWNDMHLALAQHHDDDGATAASAAGAVWEESLVAREWVDIEPDMEFRCFIAGGKLTAVSQYRHLVHWPRLCANRDAVLGALTAFCEDVARPRLSGAFPRDDYILDLAIELDVASAGGADHGALRNAPWGAGELRKVWAVEVNPFFETTDGCLFSWDRDRTTLLGAAATTGPSSVANSVDDNDAAPMPDSGRVDLLAIPFRLRERPAKGASSLLYGTWRDVMTATDTTAAAAAAAATTSAEGDCTACLAEAPAQ